MYDFETLGIDTGKHTSGKMKTHCPQCRERRSDKRDKSLSINLDNGMGKCHYCNWTFRAREKNESPGGVYTPSQSVPAHFKRPVFDQNRTKLSERAARWFVEKRCIPQEVLTRIQIGEQQEYMPQTGKPENCICFHYFEQGELVNTKFRDGAKRFKMVSGAELIPYNIDGIACAEECIITKGEIDALSFMAIGRTDVVSVPNGANSNLSFLDRFIETHFEDKRTIYIAVDSDHKGRELQRELIRRLGAECCRVVSYGPGCKDANEHLVKYGAESLRIALMQAPELPLEGVFTAADRQEELRKLFEQGFEAGIGTGLENLDKLCTFELGRLCVITGIPGSGKSEFTDELVLRVCLAQSWRAAFFSPENMPLVYHMRKHIEKLTGRPFRPFQLQEAHYTLAVDFLSDRIFHILPREDFSVDTILQKARELVRRRGIRLLVIDPFNRLEHQIPQGMSETQYISSLLDRLTNFALRHQCLVILVAHPRKMQRDQQTGRTAVPTLYDINGSAAFFNKCDFGLVVERDNGARVARIHVEKVRFRHLGHPGVASFVFNTVNGRYTPCQEDAGASQPENRISGVHFSQECWLPKEQQEDLKFTE